MYDYDKVGQWRDLARHLVLPMIVLGLLHVPGYMRYVRSSFLDVMGQDYVRTARAKGLRENAITLRHTLPNALSPFITILGLSLPGLVDPGTGRALYIPYFRWRDWNIAEEVARATGLAARVDNDANAAALAELWFGRPEVSEARDFILVLVAEGVGTGIVFDGQIYRGERGAAGEFGHMVVGQEYMQLLAGHGTRKGRRLAFNFFNVRFA